MGRDTHTDRNFAAYSSGDIKSVFFYRPCITTGLLHGEKVLCFSGTLTETEFKDHNYYLNFIFQHMIGMASGRVDYLQVLYIYYILYIMQSHQQSLCVQCNT